MPSRDLRHIDDLGLLNNVPLAPLTTFRIGGAADTFLRPETPEALAKALGYLESRALPYHILGNGSNLLVSDHGVGIVISLGRLNRIRIVRKCESEHCGRTSFIVDAQAGCNLAQLLAWSHRNHLGGLEKLAGIPASVGGAVSMNAGTGDLEFGRLVESVTLAVKGDFRCINRDGLGFDYRSSNLAAGQGVIVSARLKLLRKERDDIRKDAVATMRRRRTLQPLGSFSAGCVFKNPLHGSAGRLIDQSGLKGYNVGDARVSTKHANFIVNCGNARALDVLDLIEIIKEKIKERTGTDLVPEISIWGQD